MLLRDSIWEFYFEDNEQVSKFKWLLMERHSLPLDCLMLIWLNYLAWLILDSDLPVVQMGKDKVHS